MNDATKMTDQFLSFLEKSDLSQDLSGPITKGDITILVCPWVVMTVPLFSIATACLFRKHGFQVHILWDDIPFNVPELTHEQNQHIAKVLTQLLPYINVHRVSERQPVEFSDQARLHIEQLALHNLIWNRKSSARYEDASDQRMQLQGILERNYSLIHSAISKQPSSIMFCPGGIYGNSGLYRLAGIELGKRTAFYDCGTERLFIGNDDVAGYFTDDLRAFQNILNNHGTNVAAMQELLNLAEEEIDKRMKGVDQHNYQVVPASNARFCENDFALIPRSIDWDAPALGRNQFFQTPKEWLLETTQYILDSTNLDVVIREHPYNRNIPYENPWPEVLAEKYGAEPRVKVVAAEDEVNTYDLVAQAKVVLPYVSTIGHEAFFLGKQVVIESNVHYGFLPFFQKASSKQDYFNKISAAADGTLPMATEQERLQAKIYYLFFQKAHYLYYNFTPQPEDFDVWSTWGVNGLYEKPETQVLLNSIETNTPVAEKNIEKLLPEVSESAEPSPPAQESSDGSFPKVTFGEGVQVIGLKNTSIGEGTVIGEHSWLNVCERDDQVRLNIGKHVLVGRQSMLSTGGTLTLGDYCLLAPRVYISDADHVFDNVALPIVAQGATLGRTLTIEENCWLGVNAVVLGNVTVGRCSVVAAGCVVNSDVPPFSVVVGAPARIVKMFNPQTGAWEKIKEQFQVQRILDIRKEHPMPERSEYQKILEENSKMLNIDPIVGGGESI